ncbi:pantoate--beta-alanine ligase [Desertivirga brevis]|uniref:pantoate--beta-alanine ligase n=1 Tax=Desertivirga brevis TaxID=2810310 RepID=UPI001A975112|nr:pantoate--beta-alanine ligase [Pedobacter sp. SYSU D00873]
MKVFTSKHELSGYLDTLKEKGKIIGFVPTMGALHQGHLSLIEIAARNTDCVVCSIFVNPTQFNDPEDLAKYPRPIDADIAMLEQVNCDVLFLPAVQEMYSGDEQWSIDLGYLERILEGRFRPGHYQGVTQIVKKLFDVVQPNKAFFGQKDFQQVKVIMKMVELYSMPVEIVMCPILREEDGLAMSSRNIHLSPSERVEALALSKTLNSTRENFAIKPISQLQQDAESFLQNSEGVELEYFEICNAETLMPAESKDEAGLVALVAAKVGRTRLIDNIIIK